MREPTISGRIARVKECIAHQEELLKAPEVNGDGRRREKHQRKLLQFKAQLVALQAHEPKAKKAG